MWRWKLFSKGLLQCNFSNRVRYQLQQGIQAVNIVLIKINLSSAGLLRTSTGTSFACTWRYSEPSIGVHSKFVFYCFNLIHLCGVQSARIFLWYSLQPYGQLVPWFTISDTKSPSFYKLTIPLNVSGKVQWDIPTHPGFHSVYVFYTVN